MSDNNAKLRISMKDGEFELSGSELFVTQQIQNFKDLIVDSLKKNPFDFKKEDEESAGDFTIPAQTNQLSTIPPLNTNGKGNDPHPTTFVNVFHVEGSNVNIIKKVPGNSDAQKMTNTAMMYIWAKQAVGIATVPFNEIRQVCKNLGCLDSRNFSKTITSKKEWFVIEGSGKSQLAKLTVPGKQIAVDMINSMNS